MLSVQLALRVAARFLEVTVKGATRAGQDQGAAAYAAGHRQVHDFAHSCQL